MGERERKDECGIMNDECGEAEARAVVRRREKRESKL